ncbi:MAG: formylmethanofuran dehydrogenase subunit A [Gemmatimonadetes bacterium]|nr:formylmethanofuran dehydrogenase subunit A [Gemmatimonadota bacterium]
MSGAFRLVGGRVYDPANGVDGEVRDVCVDGGRIVASVPDGAPVVAVRGMVVMPGGVDIHCHIAGPKVGLARRLEPERRRRDVERRRVIPGADGPSVLRSGTGGTVPSTFTTGRRYAGLGYTTAFEAAVPAMGARQAHQELNDTPVIDKGFYLLLGNDDFLLRLLGAGEAGAVPDYVARMLSAARAYAVKVVNPGGVAAWKRGRTVAGLDEPVAAGGVTPRRIVEAIAGAVDALGLPHPMHIHCNNLGVPGNVATTLATMRALEGRRGHFTHIQFHSYGRTADERPTSAARRIIEYVNAHPELSLDVGQVMFGAATAMTADAGVAQRLHELTGHRWVDVDVELESGCGIVPFEYRERNYVHALQWAIGLELFLLAADPWRVVLSTDHPNGGSFLSYPRLIRLLMDRAFRDEQLRRVNPAAIAGTALADGLAREYTLSEIAIVTRAAPARLLGLERKGHLGPGADADIAVYRPDADIEAMFAAPRYVFKEGMPVVEDGEPRAEPWGRTLHVALAHDGAIEARLARFRAERGTLAPDDYRIDADELRRGEGVAARST